MAATLAFEAEAFNNLYSRDDVGPSIAVQILRFPLRAVNPVHVRKNAAVDNLLTTTMKRAPVFMQQKSTDPLFDYIADPNLGEKDTRFHQLLLRQHSHALLLVIILHHWYLLVNFLAKYLPFTIQACFLDLNKASPGSTVMVF